MKTTELNVIEWMGEVTGDISEFPKSLADKLWGEGFSGDVSEFPKSLADLLNVWSPEVNPAGWEEIP